MASQTQHISYWKTSAQRDLKTAESLFDLGRYDSCLFFCHLALEKMLKGLVVAATKEPAPFTHDLAKLSLRAGLSLSPEDRADLRVITTFNVAARYDDEKLEFYKQCTKSYSAKFVRRTNELFVWLKKQYPKK